MLSFCCESFKLKHFLVLFYRCYFYLCYSRLPFLWVECHTSKNEERICYPMFWRTSFERSMCTALSLRKLPTFRDATTGFSMKWGLRNERWNSLLRTRHYPDLGNTSGSCCVGNLLQPIKSTTQIWVVTRHQYGISALVSQTSFL